MTAVWITGGTFGRIRSSAHLHGANSDDDIYRIRRVNTGTAILTHLLLSPPALAPVSLGTQVAKYPTRCKQIATVFAFPQPNTHPHHVNSSLLTGKGHVSGGVQPRREYGRIVHRNESITRGLG